MPAGRPLKYEDVEQLQLHIDKYFAMCDEASEPYTITGLAISLKTSRETLCNYEGRPEFFDTIKTAKMRVENFAEKRLYSDKQVAGPIFALKNFGWRDTQDVNLGGQRNNPVESVTLTPQEAYERLIKGE